MLGVQVREHDSATPSYRHGQTTLPVGIMSFLVSGHAVPRVAAACKGPIETVHDSSRSARNGPAVPAGVGGGT